ncbi:MAG: histone deacetylase [Elusimicrobia bacterium]|nr:histone deacetylase [Elusimicrobiota bacterium]
MPPSFVYSPKYVIDIGDHVFPTRKFGLVAESMGTEGELIEPSLPTKEDLLLAHDADWIDKVLSGKMSLDDETLMELPFSPEISGAHQISVSGTILACRHALEHGVGLHIGGGSHHAFRNHGEGFCVLNDIACGILRMKADGKIKRAAVIDLDVHQGNGTAAIFTGDKDVFTFSMHQEDIYPERKEKSSLDVGLRAGTGDTAFLSLLEENIDKVFEHNPELVVYQAGVDCYEHDVLGGLKLTVDGLARRDKLVFEACRARSVAAAVVLGGGYAACIKDTAALHAQTLRTFAQIS